MLGHEFLMQAKAGLRKSNIKAPLDAFRMAAICGALNAEDRPLSKTDPPENYLGVGINRMNEAGGHGHYLLHVGRRGDLAVSDPNDSI